MVINIRIKERVNIKIIYLMLLCSINVHMDMREVGAEVCEEAIVNIGLKMNHLHSNSIHKFNDN